MSWIDTGPWDQIRGKELVRLLSDVYRLQAEMQMLMNNAQVPAELTPQPMRLGLMWGEAPHSSGPPDATRVPACRGG